MDWLKKKLDKFDKKSQDTGNVLGTSTPQREAIYAVQFTEQTLGFKIGKDELDGMALVVSLTPKGEAGRLKVGIGDRIVAIDGNKMSAYDTVMEVVPALSRPITLHFMRGSAINRKPVGTLNKAKNKMGMATSSTSARPLSNTERAAQREQRLAALEARENKWDKKIKEGRAATYHKDKNPVVDNRNLGVDGREQTEEQKARGAKISAEAKAHEAATAAALGYNPYEVTKSGADASRSAIATIRAGPMDSPAAAPAPAVIPMPMPGPVPAPPSFQEQTNNDLEAQQLAQAMAMSLNSGGGGSSDLDAAISKLHAQPKDAAFGATKILQKLLQNLIQAPNEEKFKTVKLSNKTIQSKVVAVPGALDVLLSAGFVSVPGEDGEQTLSYFGAAASGGLVAAEAAVRQLRDLLSS